MGGVVGGGHPSGMVLLVILSDWTPLRHGKSGKWHILLVSSTIISSPGREEQIAGTVKHGGTFLQSAVSFLGILNPSTSTHQGIAIHFDVFSLQFL